MMKEILKPRARIFLAVHITAVLILACGVSVTPTSVPGQVDTPVPSNTPILIQPVSPTPTVVTNTPSSGPTVTSTPVSSPAAALPIPAASQIRFSPGSTYGIVEGTIQAGQTLSYFLRANKGQPMIAMVSSPNNDVTLSILAQDGTVLLPAAHKATMWQGTLPETQNYYLTVAGGSSTESFTLTANIAARIQLGAGQYSTTVNGTTVNGYEVLYVVLASGGQTLEVTVNTAPEDAALTIWGFSDGQPYARAQNGVTSFSMQLPSTQDYIIEVVPQGGRVINYTLNITIK